MEFVFFASFVVKASSVWELEVGRWELGVGKLGVGSWELES